MHRELPVNLGRLTLRALRVTQAIAIIARETRGRISDLTRIRIQNLVRSDESNVFDSGGYSNPLRL